MSPPATSKTSCSLCCGDVAREVCLCVLITKTEKQHPMICNHGNTTWNEGYSVDLRTVAVFLVRASASGLL